MVLEIDQVGTYVCRRKAKGFSGEPSKLSLRRSIERHPSGEEACLPGFGMLCKIFSKDPRSIARVPCHE